MPLTQCSWRTCQSGHMTCGFRDGPETALREAVQIPSNDPLLVIPAMAAVTKNLGFGATFSTTYEPPISLRAPHCQHPRPPHQRPICLRNIVTSYLPNRRPATLQARGRGASTTKRFTSSPTTNTWMCSTSSGRRGSWDDDAVVAGIEIGAYTRIRARCGTSTMSVRISGSPVPISVSLRASARPCFIRQPAPTPVRSLRPGMPRRYSRVA